jgi:predicted permease
MLSWNNPDDTMTEVISAFVKYVCPPFTLLTKMAQGEYSKYSLIVGQYSAIKAAACVMHSLFLTVVYGVIGAMILNRRQFSCSQE